MYNAFLIFTSVTILLMPLFYFLAHFRKGKYMCRIPIVIRYIYYVAFCVVCLYTVFRVPFDYWERLADKSLILYSIRIFIVMAMWIDVAYNVIMKKYIWIQRLLEKE